MCLLAHISRVAIDDVWHNRRCGALQMAADAVNEHHGVQVRAQAVARKQQAGAFAIRAVHTCALPSGKALSVAAVQLNCWPCTSLRQLVTSEILTLRWQVEPIRLLAGSPAHTGRQFELFRSCRLRCRPFRGCAACVGARTRRHLRWCGTHAPCASSTRCCSRDNAGKAYLLPSH